MLTPKLDARAPPRAHLSHDELLELFLQSKVWTTPTMVGMVGWGLPGWCCSLMGEVYPGKRYVGTCSASWQIATGGRGV
jgi:hypothetical protein